ncbi:DUF3024 domain-containing protein [Marinomonas sp. TI.3.20]|uniref:DUF3024 domain-containing protein n=1 Tax=Marinomonas sp. TI.3.20 TaxID=3121296 RepID=UPI00311FED8F
MAISEFEIKRCENELEKFLKEKRPPAYVRAEIDLGYRIDNQSVEIFEVRPHYRDPNKKIESSVAKATYVKSKKIWKVYWMRQDLKWHSYSEVPEVKHIEDFLSLVAEDANSCFFG